MNKVIDLASGKCLNFMNNGDYFFNNQVITKIIPFLNKKHNIIYGNTEIRYKDFKIIKQKTLPYKLCKGRIPYQSAFIKTITIRKYKYNINNKMVADLDFFLNVYYHQGKIKKINQIIASFAKNGITEKKINK